MHAVLWAASASSIVWGAVVLIFPLAIFKWAQVPSPIYPELWQWIGMMSAVCGVGYGIAALNPFRHWAPILLGLVIKVLTLIGFLNALGNKRIPLQFACVAAANDAVWLLPFSLILGAVYNGYISRQCSTSPEVVRFALRTKAHTGENLETLSRKFPLLLVFLRHAGCMFCREALADISRQRKLIEASGTRIVLVHMSTDQQGETFFANFGLRDVLRVSDPKQTLYRAFGLPRANLAKIIGPQLWLRVIQAGILQRHGIGRIAGDPFQLPGIFTVYHGQILRSHRHYTAADRLDYVRFVMNDDPTQIPG